MGVVERTRSVFGVRGLVAAFLVSLLISAIYMYNSVWIQKDASMAETGKLSKKAATSRRTPKTLRVLKVSPVTFGY